MHNPINCHKWCGALRFKGKDSGGSSFRNWCALFFYRGVFAGYKNHKPCAYYLTAGPDTKWRKGCQDSRAHGNPLPRPVTGELRNVSDAPEEIRAQLLRLVEDAYKVVAEYSAEHERWKDNEKQKMFAAYKEKERAQIAAWTERNEGVSDG